MLMALDMSLMIKSFQRMLPILLLLPKPLSTALLKK